MSIVPPLYVARTVNAQRKARPLPAAEREAALTRAAEIFLSEEIAGLDFDRYVGLDQPGIGTADRGGARRRAQRGRTGGRGVRIGAAGRPAGAERDWRDIRNGGAVWARRGEVFAVHASGNAPGVHGLWPQALALGYRVAVRPRDVSRSPGSD